MKSCFNTVKVCYSSVMFSQEMLIFRYSLARIESQQGISRVFGVKKEGGLWNETGHIVP